jgi:hypothetical protein
MEHTFKTGYNTDFSSTSILDKATRYMDHVIKEAILIELHFSPATLTGMVAHSVGLGMG